MTNDEINARAVALVDWRRDWDSGLDWLLGGSLSTGWAGLTGALLLRQWSGAQQRPAFPATVGYAFRPATVVDEIPGVGRSTGNIYWLDVDRVSPAGVVTAGSGREAQAVAWTAGGWAGLIPNAPRDVQVLQGSDGEIYVQWHYNPAGQQVAPDKFYVYSDSGTGTISATAIGNVSYSSGRGYYRYHVAGAAAGWKFVVRAETAARVASLTARLNGQGLAEEYVLAAAGTVATALMASALTAPPMGVD